MWSQSGEPVAQHSERVLVGPQQVPVRVEAVAHVTGAFQDVVHVAQIPALQLPLQSNSVISSTGYIIQPLILAIFGRNRMLTSSPPLVSASLRGARGNIGALRAAQIVLIAGVAA